MSKASSDPARGAAVRSNDGTGGLGTCITGDGAGSRKRHKCKSATGAEEGERNRSCAPFACAIVPRMPDAAPANPLPYKIAVLCDLRDERGRILLIRRKKHPNFGLCSPIGGKLDMHTGESPAQCARREIMEEAGIDVPIER